MMSEAPSQLMIAAEVARWLRLSCSTTYAWAAAGKIPCVRLGGAIRFVHSDIERWIHERTYLPTEASALESLQYIATAGWLSRVK